MRILIVNAHAQSAESQKAFQDLLACVKEILKMHSGLLEMKDEYIVRNKDNLEDFLYDEHTSFSQPNPGKQFDSLDFVIVSGDLHSLPWHACNHKVLTLLRMCMRVKKCLFAIGFAMQALVYLSASNLDQQIHIINGNNGRGGKLGDMARMHLNPTDIQSNDYFLDNVTGDLYHFQHESNEWVPTCNVGLHHKRTAEEFNTIGKFVIKTPIYRPKKSIHNNGQGNMPDENIERKCYLKKIYLRHWLFNECGMEFIIPYKGAQWEVHSFSFTNKDKAFEVLAESENGPLIVEYNRMVGVKFMVTKRYKETYQLLQNFILKYASEIVSNGKSQNMSILVHATYLKSHSNLVKFQPMKPNEPEYLKNSAMSHQRNIGTASKTMQGFRYRGPTTGSSIDALDDSDVKVFKHSGLASKMKGKYIQDHNFISTGKVRYDSRNTSPTKPGQALVLRDSVNGKHSLAPIKSPKGGHDLSFLEPVHTIDGHIEKFGRHEKHVSHNGASSMRPKTKGVLINDTKGFQKYSLKEEESNMTKADVRRLLYPELGESETKFDSRFWVPGNLSQAKTDPFRSTRVIRIDTSGPSYRKKGPLDPIHVTDADQQSLRATTPYQTYFDLSKAYQKGQDAKIIGPKKFNMSKGNSMIQTFSSSGSFENFPRYSSAVYY